MGEGQLCVKYRGLISVRSGLCTSAQLGGFITTLPSNMKLNETSIYTTPLKFSEGSFPTTPVEAEPISTPEEGEGVPISTPEDGEVPEGEGEGGILEDIESPPYITDDKLKRRQWDIIESITNGVKGSSSGSEDLSSENEGSGERQDEAGERQEGGAVYEVPQYTGAVHYKVPKTGYYCVGTSLHIISPSHLLNSNPSKPIIPSKAMK
jgi:hypothetical protein